MRRLLEQWLLPRATLTAAVFSFALGLSVTRSGLPGRDVEAFVAFLEEAAEAEVERNSLAWEPSRGLFGDLIWGRRILFLARPEPAGEAANDVYRARVRVTREGHPLEVLTMHNLTETPAGDEAALQLLGSHAAFAAFDEHQVQGVTILGLEGADQDDLSGNWFNRTLLRLRAFQETDSLLGLARSHLRFRGASSAELELGARHLTVRRRGAADLVVDLAARRLLNGSEDAELTRQPLGGGYWLHTLADLVREELGAGAVARMVRYFFGFGASLRHAGYEVFGEGAMVKQQPVEAPEASASRNDWPPRAIEPMSSEPRPGEGQWSRALPPWPPPEGEGPGAFYRTFVRPDAERPYVELHLMAMDMRRLELRMEAGYEDPKPKKGLPGRGSLPPDRGLLGRVRATFNGAFKSLHGDYGMVVDRRVLVPPVAGAATVVLTERGETGFGVWPQTKTLPPDIISLRQNLDPLLAFGRLNPSRRTQWGEHLFDEGAFAERSALCLAASGHVYYAWGRELSPSTLSRGLEHAGCSFAIHLDMNPGHCGFFFHRMVGDTLDDIEGASAFAGVDMLPTRFARWSSKDFFYVVARQAALGTGKEWLPSPGMQPEPDWLVAFTRSTVSVGSMGVNVWRIAPGRVSYDLIAGEDEPLLEGRPAPRRGVPGDAVPLFALNLGHTTLATRYGLAFQREASIPLRRVYGTLLISGDQLSVVRAGEQLSLAEGEMAVQLPELMVDGALTERTHERGALRQRGAVCVLADGSLLFARVKHDSTDVLALALKQLGCGQVLELDRGSQHPTFFHREGTNEPLRAQYATTVLIGASQPMDPRTFQWQGGDGEFERLTEDAQP